MVVFGSRIELDSALDDTRDLGQQWTFAGWDLATHELSHAGLGSAGVILGGGDGERADDDYVIVGGWTDAAIGQR